MDEMKIYVMAAGAFVVFIVLMLLLSIFSKSKILPKLKQIKKKMFWNNIIKSIKIAYVKLLKSSGK